MDNVQRERCFFVRILVLESDLFDVLLALDRELEELHHLVKRPKRGFQIDWRRKSEGHAHVIPQIKTVWGWKPSRRRVPHRNLSQ
jgi:hypothetical protein